MNVLSDISLALGIKDYEVVGLMNAKIILPRGSSQFGLQIRRYGWGVHNWLLKEYGFDPQKQYCVREKEWNLCLVKLKDRCPNSPFRY